MSTATATRFKHAFDEQTNPNHRLWLPQRREYVEFRAGRFETDDDAVADEIIWCAEAGYTAAVYHSPEEQEAHAYVAEKKRAALARVAARLRLSEPTAVDAAEAEAVLASVRAELAPPQPVAQPRCQGTRKDGQPCQLRPMLNSAFCRMHGLKRIADEEDK
jgi:hypothetical protein